MLLNLVRSAAAFISGLVILIGTGVLTQNLFRGDMLSAAGWQPGTTPPSDYVWATLASDCAGSLLAGFALKLIAGKWSTASASILILFVAVTRLYQYLSALEQNPHWYAVVLVVIPAVLVPIGVIVARKIIVKRN